MRSGHKSIFLPLERDQAAPIMPQRPTFIRHWSSSSWSSAMNWSWDQEGSMLSTTLYYPWLTCSATFRISWSVDPSKALTNRCSEVVSLAMVIWWEWGHLCMCHCHSLLLIAVVLWNRHSSRNSPHSWHQITFQLGCPLLSSSKNSCPWELT